jgi:predicted MFS family arabinose efflux permease
MAPDGGPRPASTRRLLVFFAVVYAVQGLAEPGAGLATQPIFFLLKDELRLSAAETSAFLALVGIPWTLKPAYGLLSDLLPLAGRRRRSWLVVMAALASVGWLALGLLPGYPYRLTLMLLLTTGLGLAFTDVVTDAVMVEEGQRRGLTGRFQSVQWAAIHAASLGAGVAGGLLAEQARYSTAFLIVAALPLASLVAAAWAVPETRGRFDRASAAATLRALGRGLRQGPLWRAGAFILLWNFSPSFGVPLDYYQVDTLGFTRFQMGVLETVDSAGALAGALLFGLYGSRLPLARLLAWSVAAGVAGTLAYLGLAGWWTAVSLGVVVSLAGMVAQLATLDLAARAVPAGAEGTFFAALMALMNLGASGSTYLGGQIFDVVGLTWLIVISAAATGACGLLIPRLRLTSA